MAAPLPPFKTVTQPELRRLWTAHADPDVRRLILEVEHGRRCLAEVNALYEVIVRAWREEVGGNLVALHRLQTVLYNERSRGV